VGTILAGAVVGFLVDRWLGWAPVGVMTGTILGAAGGFVQLIHVLRRLDHVDGRPEP
jgi:F0F1-type ATP synthase assembly protein I